MSLPSVASVPRPLAEGYDIRINQTLWQAAPNGQNPLNFAPAEIPRERINLAENPEDFSASEIQRRFSRRSFAGGEGLDVAHSRDGGEADFTRFWESRRLLIEPTVPGQPEETSLLGATRTLDSYPAATFVEVATIGDSLFVIRSSQSTVERYDDPLSLVPTAVVEDPAPGSDTLTGMVRIGTQLFVGAQVDGVRRRSPSGVWSVWSADNTTALWTAKGRLLARGIDRRELLEINEGLAATVIATLPDGAEWTDLVDAGEVILASATDGYLYAIAEDAGNLVVAGQSEMKGEEPMSLGHAHGTVLVGTRQRTHMGGYVGRLWRGVVEGNQVGNMSVVRAWGDEDTVSDWTPSAILPTRDDAFVWVRDRLWRYLLRTGGLVSYLETDLAGKADLGLVGNLAVIAATDETTGGHLVLEDTDLETQGYLISPAIDFFDDKPKHWSALALFHAPLAPGTRLRVYYSLDRAAQVDPNHPSWRLAVSRIGPTGPNDSDIPISARGRWLVVMVELIGSGSSPVVYGFSVLAYPSVGDMVATIPINVSGWINAPRRQRIFSRPLAKLRWQALLGYGGQEVELEYYTGGQVLRGIVESVDPPIAATTPGALASLVATIVVRGSRVPPAGSTILTGNALGIPTLGGAPLGGSA